MPDGRFAPSPTGDLHLGNLRTALLAWLFARADGSRVLLRIEDLDPATVRPGAEERQRRDLAAIGLDWDGPVVHQSARRARHEEAVATLVGLGLTYPCYCTRREVIEAGAAPHGEGPDGAYPGTCRDLGARARAEREAAGRRPALRVRADGARIRFTDAVVGPYEGLVDDLVVRRNDGTPAYNLAVIVDDADQGVGQVVRGDDLLGSTPRQLHLAALLGLVAPGYAHVPLVLAPDGVRLAKRHGAVTLDDRLARGESPEEVLHRLLRSLGAAVTVAPGRDEPGQEPPGEPGPAPGDAAGDPAGVAAGDAGDAAGDLAGEAPGGRAPIDLAAVAAGFDPRGLPREPWVLDADVV